MDYSSTVLSKITLEVGGEGILQEGEQMEKSVASTFRLCVVVVHPLEPHPRVRRCALANV